MRFQFKEIQNKDTTNPQTEKLLRVKPTWQTAGWKVLTLQMVYKLLWKSTSSRAGNIIHWDHQQPWPGVHFRGGVIRVWQISWPLPHNCSFIFRFFWRKSRTKRLPGDLSRNRLVTLGLSDRSRCGRGAHFEIARATGSAFWGIALCGAVRILKSLARDPRHFGRVRSPFRLSRRSCAQILARRSSIENLCRDLATETSYRDLVQRASIEIL